MKEFWVCKMRQSIKKKLQSCVHCKKVQTPPLRMAPPPPLPPARLKLQKPFSVAGVDYSGGFSVYNSHVNVVYLLLFTCSTTRAVALEVTESLTTVELLQALRRFASRFGMPTQFISDNASTFHCASDFLKTVAQSPEVQAYCSSNNLSWKFITLRSP